MEFIDRYWSVCGELKRHVCECYAFVLSLIFIRNVKGAYERAPFDPILFVSAGSLVFSRVFERACLRNVGDRCVRGKVSNYLGTGSVVCNMGGGYVYGWSCLLSLPLDNDVYGCSYG